MEETKVRKHIDYSASTVNLCNPLDVQIDIHAYAGLSKHIEEVKAQIDATIPQELKDLLSSLQCQLEACLQAVKTDIDAKGSYQDLVQGWYALKQRKVSVSYDAARFEYLYPQYAPAIIVKAVDTAKLKGLIKGGLLKEEDLKHPDVGIAKETETFVYIIKV